jgi:ABC-2 type transport system permease protein
MPIFDQGYQHWKGHLTGHAWRWYAISRHGVRAQLRNWFVRILLLVAWLPALLLIGMLALWGMLEQQVESVLLFMRSVFPSQVVASPEAYRQAIWTIAYSFFFKAELVVVLFLVVVVGPNLISRDLRFNALPLYFARPVTRLDYFVGKLGVLAFFIAAVVVGPALVAYVLGVCFSLDLSVVKDTHHLLWGSLAYGAVIVLSVGPLMLALSSLSRRSVYVALAWVGLWLISASLSGILIGIQEGMLQRQFIRTEMADWIEKHPPPPGITLFRGMYPSVQPSLSHQAEALASAISTGSPLHGQPWNAVALGLLAQTMSQPSQTPEAQRWMQEWSRAQGLAWARFQSERIEARRTDWRPLCSYGNNLDRMGDLLLDTDTAWVTMGKALEAPRAMMGGRPGRRRGGPFGPGSSQPGGERFLADQMVYQYPWVWSAGVLAGLLGLSLWVVSSRVKSLDRLK